jgi:hypothetical protein
MIVALLIGSPRFRNGFLWRRDPWRSALRLAILVLCVLAICYAAGRAKGEEGGTAIPGLASFQISELTQVGSHYEVLVEYDATTAGNLWEGGIYGYGEIDRFRRATIWMMVFRNETKAATFVLAADELYPDGYAGAEPIYWIRKHAESKCGISVIPDPTLKGDSRSGTLPEDTPLTGSLDANLSLTKLPVEEALYAVFWACIEYEGFSKYMYNIDYRGPLQIVYSPDITLIVDGPTYVTPKDEEVTFNLTVSGGDAGEIDRIDWFMEYSTGEGWASMDPMYGSLTSGLKLDHNRLSSLLELLEEHGEEGELDLRVSARAYRMYRLDLIASSNLHSFTLGHEEKVRSRMVFLPEEFPVKHIRLAFSNPTLVVETGTDSEGVFEIPSEMLDGGDYSLEIRFQYARDDKTYYSMHYNFVSTPITLRLQLQGEEITKVELTDGATYTLSENPGINIAPELDLDELVRGHTSEGKAYLYLYQHLTEALEFYTDYLGVQFDATPPLTIQTYTDVWKWQLKFVSEAEWGDEIVHGIVIDTFHMDWAASYTPKNREYHEFSHYAMYEIYGGFPDPPPGPVPEKNHGGFTNPSTADSYVEGFAHFMSMVIGEHYGFWWDDGDYPSRCGILGDLELDYVAWSSQGKDEEYAIAGILWDLYDGDAQHERALEVSRSLYRSNLESYDTLRPDGCLDREEIFLRSVDRICRSRYGVSFSSLLDILSRNDANGDGFVDMAELQEAIYDDIFKKAVWYQQDPGTIMDTWGTEGRLEPLSLVFWAIDLSEDEAEAMMQSLPERTTLEDMLAELAAEDDDGIDLDFKELWTILETYHRDFTSVYEALIARYPEASEGINSIFVKHGFFADRDPGNRAYDKGEPFRDLEPYNQNHDEGEYFVDLAEPVRYDEGESIGNSTNYERPGRRSYEPSPGHFIKVDNALPWYAVEIEVFEDPAPSLGVPSRFIALREENRDGLIYVPVPPESYNATVSVRPDGFDQSVSLTFASEAFHEALPGSASQGFYLEHDFGVGEGYWSAILVLASFALICQLRRLKLQREKLVEKWLPGQAARFRKR